MEIKAGKIYYGLFIDVFADKKFLTFFKARIYHKAHKKEDIENSTLTAIIQNLYYIVGKHNPYIRKFGVGHKPNLVEDINDLRKIAIEEIFFRAKYI